MAVSWSYSTRWMKIGIKQRIEMIRSNSSGTETPRKRI